MIELPEWKCYREIEEVAQRGDLSEQEKVAQVTELKKLLARFSDVHPRAPYQPPARPEESPAPTPALRPKQSPPQSFYDLSAEAQALFKKAPEPRFSPDEWISQEPRD